LKRKSFPEEAMAASSTTAHHVLDVLLLFNQTRPRLTAEEIGNLINAPRSSTYRYIRTLRERGLLQQTADGGFTLGPRVLQLAHAVRSPQNGGNVLLSVMRKLSQRTRETVVLIRLFDRTPMCVERVLGPQTMRISLEQGQVQPLHAGAASKVLLAHLPEATWDTYLAQPLESFTEHTIADPQELKSRLRQIRQQGYSVSDGEIEIGVRAVAVPVHVGESDQLFALSILGPAFRLDGETVTEYRKLLQIAAKAIEEQASELLL
jgi:DNA-binding IclR family transcriptional regulator